MDDSQDPALLAEIEDIRDEIALKEAILESLHDNGQGSDDEDVRKRSKKDLKRLKKHLRVLQSAPKDEDDDEAQSRSLNEIPEAAADDHSKLGSQPDRLMPPTSYKLASRKRQRNLSDDDERPESSKSRRTTPISSHDTPSSPALSSASLDSLDDPFLDSLLGLSKEEVEHNQDYWKQKEQRENDEKLAQSLSQDWQGFTDASDTQPTIPRHADYTQSFLRPSGSFVKAEPSSNARPLSAVKPEPGSTHASPSDVLANSTFRTSVKHEPLRNTLGHIKDEPGSAALPSMPGAFPDSTEQQQPFDSMGGIPVYNAMSIAGPSQQDPLPGQLDSSLGDDALARPIDYSLEEYGDSAQTQAELRDLLQHIRPDEELTANQMPEQPHGSKSHSCHISLAAWLG